MVNKLKNYSDCVGAFSCLIAELDGEIAMKNTYMQNMGMTLQQYSLSAFKTHGGKSWDNRKKKGYKKYVPRGTVYQRLVSQEWKSVTRPLIELAQKWHEEYGI